MNLISLPELDQFEKALQEFAQGKLSFEEFKKIRVWQGVYTMRGTSTPPKYMIRIKVPQGRLTPAQLRRVAQLARAHSLEEQVHLTTRQGIELYGVEQNRVMEVLRSLAEVNLTTRETGGNGVRNVTACPLTGIAPDEIFDVTPYAWAFSQFFLRHPLGQNLPRKVKVSFESCPADHTRAMVQDIGVFASIREGQRGFQIYVGGGLGGSPQAAQLLENFTPAAVLLATAEAILRVFDRHGGRQSRDRARIKYLIKDWGIERFREEVFQERKKILKEGRAWPVLEKSEEFSCVPRKKSSPSARVPDEHFARWLEYNVKPQKQSGFNAVFIRCLLGDISARQLEALSQAAEKFCQGRVRTTITQNLLLRGVPQGDLATLYSELKASELTQCCAEYAMDITRCAGANSCLSALTYSSGLALELGKIFSNGLSHSPEIMSMTTKVSGCPHACGQHHIADLGFHGAMKVIYGRQVPHYQILLGGATQRGEAHFAQPLCAIPARRVPSAVQHLLRFYLQNKTAQEPLRHFVSRIGVPRLQEELSEFTAVLPYEQDPDVYKDWGSEEDYKVQSKKGECSA